MIKVGDKVKYSARFLRSAGFFTGPIPFARGTVTGIRKLGTSQIAQVDWQDPEIPDQVNVLNLTLTGKVEPA